MSNRDIIVIGGSSGATAPLKEILGRLSPDIPAAVFVVLHVPAGGIGILSTVVNAVGRLPVKHAAHGMPIENGTVYLAAPDHHLLVVDGQVVLGRGPHENMVRPAVNPLFRSAALHYGPRVIGVILSGLLSDGATGLNAIKRCGGVAVVQAPTDALADEMPRRALEAGPVDYCLPGAEIGDVLAELTETQAGAAGPAPLDIRLEVEMAAGERGDSETMAAISRPAASICPSCGGVLSSLTVDKPLRFRCQVGLASTADVLAREQERRVDEAMRVALRIIDERAELVRRMGDDARASGRNAIAEMYEGRCAEYRRYADLIRQVVIKSLDLPSGER
ncbi:chemotaxis protein CheB [Bradyrhizobium sp. SRS-191]|uniref:chemotaxis protein CheB n=1 Tax=Bradyrhizobium sp. SRS-191 TaxID=2962606 RepID=UPI00211E09A9|nr:chemotaxis protein CheB [Bradyrhizobium sp. SRS-191]